MNTNNLLYYQAAWYYYDEFNNSCKPHSRVYRYSDATLILYNTYIPSIYYNKTEIDLYSGLTYPPPLLAVVSSLPPYLYRDRGIRGTLYWVGRTAITHVRPRWYSRGAPYLFSRPRIIIIQKRPNRTTVSGTENPKTHSISFGPVPDVKQRTTAAATTEAFSPRSARHCQSLCPKRRR